jgi:hypothetical protein
MSDTSDYVAIPIDDEDITRQSIAEEFHHGLNENDEKQVRYTNFQYTVGCAFLLIILGLSMLVLCRVILKL